MMYKDFTIPDFIEYVTKSICGGRCWVGRNSDNCVDALLIYEPRMDTIYVETYIGNIRHHRQIRDELFAPYSYFESHRNFQQRRIKLK